MRLRRVGAREALAMEAVGVGGGGLGAQLDRVVLGQRAPTVAGDGLDPIRKHLLGDIGMRVDVMVA